MSMGPKAFIPCYVCFREFGSRSIPFHEPKCLERWRSYNRTLPPEKRSPTPVKPIGWKHDTDSVWICTNCRVSVPASRRGEHAATCFVKNGLGLKSGSLIGRKIPKDNMAADIKTQPSPKKGKENKNRIINNTKVDVNHTNLNGAGSNNNKHGSLDPQNKGTNSNKNEVNNKKNLTQTGESEVQKLIPDKNNNEDQQNAPKEMSTSNRSVRPQTKILRRPTPNLKHPVIQVDSDESGDSSEKSKDDNPKRLKTNNDSTSAEHKPKNFIMYNKYNVEKNIKNSPKERSVIVKDTSAGNVPIQSSSTTSIPFPCNSCSRSFAPERLHSHSRKDARGIMLLKKVASVDGKLSSPQRKIVAPEVEEKKLKQVKSVDQETVSQGKKDKLREDGDKPVPISKNTTDIGGKKGDNLRMRYLCYLCGKAFTASALSIHESKCLERWKKENEQLSPSHRKPVPTKPELAAKPEPGSSDPSWQVVQAQLVPCPSCGRTFFPERLPVHQRVCKGKAAPQSLVRTNSLKERSVSQAEEDGDKSTLYVPCYICNRSFGSWVIQMHESQCLRKWRRDNEKLPEQEQQPEPHKPQLVLTDDDPADLETTEDVAWESHLQQLVPCPRCGRTFFPDRLQVHGRSCKGPVDRHPRSNKGA